MTLTKTIKKYFLKPSVDGAKEEDYQRNDNVVAKGGGNALLRNAFGI